jgi:RNA polymerase sigma-70 factor (ECF subfamily)
MVAARDTLSSVERLYRQEGARLERAILAHTRSRVTAQDAVSEAFAQLLRRGDEVRDPRAWVWRAAFRIANGQMAIDRRNVPIEEVFHEPTGDSQDLLQALHELSPKQRAAIILHYYAGYRARDIAGIIGSTSGAVRVHLSTGRRRLRDLLEEHDG